MKGDSARYGGAGRGIAARCAVAAILVSAATAWADLRMETGAAAGGAINPAAYGAGGSGAAGSSMAFNFTKGAGIIALESGTPSDKQLANDVVSGFQQAGSMWSTRLFDSITVNVSIDYTSLPSGVLGSTSNVTALSSYSSTSAALAADVMSADDATAVANLQGGANLDFLTNNTSVTPSPVIRDSNGSANNRTLKVPRANLKALGIISGNNPAQDGAITFSSGFTWDFDPGDGITTGAFDFVGVAAHEIAHLMGFVSGVDTVDYYGGIGPGAPLNTDVYGIFSVLDLYRYSADSVAADGQPATGAVLDLAFGDGPYFSIDAGVTNLATFSTGKYNGDSRQASHWKDNLGLGIVDPTAATGELLQITALDVQAFDVIGYDIPEPATLVLLAIGGMVVMLRRRRRAA